MKKTFLLIAAAILSMAAMAETTTITVTPNGDTWVRKNVTTNADKRGADTKMEVRTQYVTDGTNVTTDVDFVGLLSFSMPVIPVGATNVTATLVLTTERIKSDANINIFPLGVDFDETKVNYSDVSTAIATARQSAAWASFQAKGEWNKACTTDGVGETYKSVSAWQNSIDLTQHVSSYTGTNLTLFLSQVNTDQGASVCFFTKEQGDFTPTTDGKGIALTAEEACPKLIITYEGNAIVNANTKVGYETLKAAVEAATAGDRILINSDITVLGSRVDVKKALTIEGATGEETITCGVANKSIMILSNGSGDGVADYTLTIKNLTIDGNNTERGTQIVENGTNKSKIAFENVSIVNTMYADTVVCGDVKNNGSNIVLVGNNTFANGIYLNKDKRIDNLSATHTADNPVTIYLHSDYQENFAIVLNCADAALYKAYDAANKYDWTLTVVTSGAKKELKGTKTTKPATAFEQVEEAEKVVKVMENGQVFILRNGVRYNILGAQF